MRIVSRKLCLDMFVAELTQTAMDKRKQGPEKDRLGADAMLPTLYFPSMKTKRKRLAQIVRSDV